VKIISAKKLKIHPQREKKHIQHFWGNSLLNQLSIFKRQTCTEKIGEIPVTYSEVWSWEFIAVVFGVCRWGEDAYPWLKNTPSKLRTPFFLLCLANNQTSCWSLFHCDQSWVCFPSLSQTHTGSSQNPWTTGNPLCTILTWLGTATSDSPGHEGEGLASSNGVSLLREGFRGDSVSLSQDNWNLFWSC
jgi:hypothetical protein